MMEITEKEFEKRLLDAGNNLLSPPSSTSELLTSLDEVERMLAVVEQSPIESMKEALAPLTKALIAEELLRHADVDVKVAVASCISEITRITAPDAPYEDDPMKEVFQLIVSTFEKLDDTSNQSYGRRISILETVAKVRSCVVMLDLQCDDLIVEMFKHFFRTIREDHHVGVFSSMEIIMTLVVEESEDISLDLLTTILNVLRKEGQEALPIACRLGENVFVKCASKLKPYLLTAIRSVGGSLTDYCKAVTDVFQTGDEAVEPTVADVANKNAAEENNLVDASSEKAVEVAMEALEDAPPPEEVGPSTAGSPKTIMSNGTLEKNIDNTVTASDNSKEADVDTQGEKAEPSEAVDDSAGAEEPPKIEANQEKPSSQKEPKPNSTISTEPLNSAVSDAKTEETGKLEHQDDAKIDDIQCKDPTGDTTKLAEDEKSSELPIPSPKTSGNEGARLSSVSPTGLADEACSKKNEQEEKTEEQMQESEKTEDIDKPERKDDTIPSDVRCEDPVVDTVEAGEDKKLSDEAPIPSPKTSGNECAGISPASPTALADETCSKNSEQEEKREQQLQESDLADETCSMKTELEEKREERIQESEMVSDADSEKESDTKNDSDTDTQDKEATAPESKLNQSSDKEASSASDPEESVPDSAGDARKEDDSMDELDGNSTQGLAQVEEAELEGVAQEEEEEEKKTVKKKLGQAKPTPARSRKKKSASGKKKKTVAAPKSTPKVTNYDSDLDLDEALGSSLKRKRPSAGKKVKTKVYGAEVVGAKVKVWWPVDQEYYRGMVNSYDSVKKRHKIFYDDGEVEILNLKEEEWQFVSLSEEHENDDDGGDESADETPKGKKAKTNADVEAKGGKTMSSTKKSGASSSRSKAVSKFGSKQNTAKIPDKAKEESSKKGGKSDLDKSGKSAKVSKSGSKLIDDTPKAAGKSKDNNMDTPLKGCNKSKPDVSKGASKSKGKTPTSVGKSSSSKLKVSANHDDTEDESEAEITPEKPKAKSQSAPKSQKSSNKRKRSAKG